MGKQLSKSKLLAFRQCPKRLWLEVYRPDLRVDSAASQVAFAVGNTVGDIARQTYDLEGQGVLLDGHKDGFAQTYARTKELLAGTRPIFEAGFQIDGALSFADVMLPAGGAAWRMVEVKSSTEVKPYHRDDAAIQSFIARTAGANLASIAVAHIDNEWVYPGDGDYVGLLKEEDVTAEAFGREDDVRGWLQEAQRVVASDQAPQVAMGEHCRKPFECGFCSYCERDLRVAKVPASQLPVKSKRLKAWLADNDVIELADVPDHLLNAKQARVKRAALSGDTYFDKAGARAALAGYALPAYFMDFETYQFAVPIWKGTRPYQMIPFQYSVHWLSEDGTLEHRGFLDLSGGDPSLAFARQLIEDCGTFGPIYVYNAGFENSRIKDLADRFPDMASKLHALVARVVDLLPIAREHFYHPSQMGSWSIKKVLPAACPGDPLLDYANLEGVQHGGAAMDAFAEAINADTTRERKTEIKRQLIDYCKLDTYAMVKLWEVFGGSSSS